MNLLFAQIDVLKKQMLGLITFKSSNRMKLHLFTGLSTMGSNSNTNCQITASIIESYTSVLTSNQGFASVETMLAR